MSADNYELIKKSNGKFILYHGCASNDYRKETGTFDTLEDAINASEGSEYGLSFDLGPAIVPAPTPVKINEIPNKDIIEVMTQFEVEMDIKLRPVDEQRRYAKFLIKDYGIDKVLQGIKAVSAARGRPYSPSITSLKELHFKWGKLVDFYKRNQRQASNVTNLDNI